jgi:hypothetical protein
MKYAGYIKHSIAALRTHSTAGLLRATSRQVLGLSCLTFTNLDWEKNLAGKLLLLTLAPGDIN